MASVVTCPNCGKSFLPWRGKQFCSERCRKVAQNRRLRRDETESATTLPDSQKTEKILEQNQQSAEAVRRDEGPAELVRAARWVAVNEVTMKLDLKGRALAWAMLVKDQGGWFGRVRDDRGNWSFGPTRRERALKAAEAWMRHEPFEVEDDERMWKGMLDVTLCLTQASSDPGVS